ncbi:MAG TPA: macro domain-containing protein [Armatimonadota bacterium]
MEYSVGGKVLEVTEGDISAVTADALVNAANNQLWMGSGVAGALKRAGGVEIEREAMAKGPIRVGEAVETGAGRLPARYVIHAAAMGDTSPSATEATVRSATRASLGIASRLGLESIAFPALGTGVGGFPVEEAARVMVGESADHLRGQTSLRRVVFALFGRAATVAFEAAAQAEAGRA